MVVRVRSVFVLLVLAATSAACVSTRTSTSETSSAASTSRAGNEPGRESDARRRARIRMELGASYFTRGEIQVAIDELRNSVAADPDFPDAYDMLGLVYMSLGERREAESNFQRALSLAPADPEVNNNYGWFLCQTDRAAQSIAHFQAALRDPLYATPAIAQRNAGICSSRLGDSAAALDYLQRSFRADPSNAATMFNLADVLYKRGDYSNAQFYVQRLNRQIDVTAQTLWLELKIDHKLGDRNAEEVIGTQLRRLFPDAKETTAWNRGAFDD